MQVLSRLLVLLHLTSAVVALPVCGGCHKQVALRYQAGYNGDQCTLAACTWVHAAYGVSMSLCSLHLQ